MRSKETGLFDLDALRFGLVFGEAHPGDFGVGVGDAGDDAFFCRDSSGNLCLSRHIRVHLNVRIDEAEIGQFHTKKKVLYKVHLMNVVEQKNTCNFLQF